MIVVCDQGGASLGLATTAFGDIKLGHTQPLHGDASGEIMS